VQAHVAEFRFAESEVAETEGQILAVRVQLREELGGVAVGAEEPYDGLEIDGASISGLDGGTCTRFPRRGSGL
jgi:hypothetical protein